MWMAIPSDDRWVGIKTRLESKTESVIDVSECV